MKKLLIALTMVLVLLTGCNKEKEEPREEVVITKVESFAVDMSRYRNMSSTNHQFVGITPETFLNLLKAGGNGIIYVGDSGCPVCNRAVPVLNDAAQELGVTVYYIDCYHPVYPLMEYINEFIAATKPILNVHDGEPTVFTPHVFTVVNGEFVDSLIGIGELDPETSEEDYQELKDTYMGMMDYFKVD